MRTLTELLKRGLVNDLVLRDVNNSMSMGEYKYIEEALKAHNIDVAILPQIRSEIFDIKLHEGQIEIDEKLKKIITYDIARTLKVLPLKDNLVGVLDPEEPEILKKIHELFIEGSTQYTLKIINIEEYQKGVELLMSNGEDKDLYYGKGNLVLSDVNKATIDSEKKEADDITEDRIDLEEYKDRYDEVPIDKLVNSILFEAMQLESSDIHIEHMGETVRVRYRVDGILLTKLILKQTMHSAVTARIKILSDMKLDEKRKPQDGRFSIRVKASGNSLHKIDFRVSTMPSYYGEKVVMRILDSYRGIRKLEKVGFSRTHLDQIRRGLERPYGMIIISGPTGSGKTTTLYSMLNELDKEKRNVVSLEDPIEYNVPNVNQSQIFPEIGYTFATGLRSILRQDPDVIMVGEIRDKETAELAIQAALTGHLVFSTIHTNNSIGVITRLMDMGIDPYLIAPTIVLAIAQRLTPMIYPGCAAPVDMTPAVANIAIEQFKNLDDKYKIGLDLTRPFSQAIPNEKTMTGTKGRMPVLEILEVDNEIQEAILKRKSDDEIFAVARSKGMLTMREDAMIKSMDGLVPFVEIAGL